MYMKREREREREYYQLSGMNGAALIILQLHPSPSTPIAIEAHPPTQVHCQHLYIISDIVFVSIHKVHVSTNAYSVERHKDN